MNKKIKLNIKTIFTIMILFIVLFHNQIVYAEQEAKDGKYILKCYTEEKALDTQVSTKDFTVNSEHGWYEYEVDGVKYVVLSAATDKLKEDGNYEEKDYIHYFKNKDIIKFKFEDSQFNIKEYYGMILGSSEIAMEADGKDTQILEVYVPNETPKPAFVDKKVWISDKSTYSIKAGESKEVKDEGFFRKIFRNIFGGLSDIINTWINDTGNDIKDPYTLPITASWGDISLHDDLQEQLQVTDYNEEVETKTIATIDISDTIDNSEGKKETVYAISTEIPMISIDLYSTSIGKVDFLDVNFLGNKSNSSKAWKIIQSIVLTVSHAAIYISTGLLIVMLIIRAIIFLTSSFTDNPAGAKESKDIMDSIIKAIVLLVGIYVIIALCTNFYNFMVNMIIDGNDSIYLLRVKVQNVYAFNTNFIGYLKFLSLRSNILAAFGYSALYFLYTLINAEWFLFMFLRMLLIGVLIIIAPLTAVTSMRGSMPIEGTHIENMIRFGSWFRIFSIWLWTPFIAVIILRIILYLM